MLQRLYRNVILRAYEGGYKRRSIFRYLADLEASQWLPREELERRQLASLRELLLHAQTHCPYYRSAWFRLDLDPQDLRCLEDFWHWPIIDRQVIRARRMHMRAQAPGLRLLSKSTGGSSGEPLHFDLDFNSHDRREAARQRGYGWAGAGPGTKQLFLWGVPLGQRPWWRRCKDLLYHQLQRRLVLNCFELSDERVPHFLRQLNRYRPDVIVAYTNALYTFARCLEQRGLTPFAPRSIIVGAEKLYPFQRKLIERVFQAPLFETYGSREVMLMGAECDRHQGLHVTMEHLLVEILEDDGTPTPEGQEGNVVVTDLFNYGMPFIRYATGDRAVAGWGTCSCGRGLPLLRRVVGRQLDVLETTDGRRIPGEFFPHLLKDVPEVKRFQVVQNTPDHIELRLVLDGPLSPASGRLLQSEVESTFGPSLHFELIEVDHIPLTSAGKHQVVVNRCGSPLVEA
jgi:phenylacetate-CoA ligase